MKKVLPFLVLASSIGAASAQNTPLTLFRVAPTAGTFGAASSSTGLALNQASFGALRKTTSNDHVRFPLSTGEMATGQVFYAHNNGAYRRVAGKLTGKLSGTFSLSIGAGQVAGLIDVPQRKTVYKIQSQSGGATLKPVERSTVVCTPSSHFKKPQPQASNAFAANATKVVPVLNSRPEARAQIYIDFDGETITDPSWNGGETVNLAATSFDDAAIKRIFGLVAEDYLAFNVNITTDAQRYAKAPAGLRMRCLVSPNRFYGDDAGGIAQIGSFSLSGRGYFSPTVPSFAFDYDGDPALVRTVGEAVSHEVGHTLGLLHDGRKLPDSGHEEYFKGHGPSSSSWGPIMGAPENYTEPNNPAVDGTKISQWSRGTYKDASNPFQDDLSIIAGRENGFGYAPDDIGNLPLRGLSLPVSTSGTFGVNSAINGVNDVDYFPFSTAGGNFNISAKGVDFTNLNIELRIEDAKGQVLFVNSPDDSFNAALSGTLRAGKYFVRVRGVGQGNGFTEGFTNYANFGRYTLSGQVASATQLKALVDIVTPPSSSQIEGIVPLEAKTTGDAKVNVVRFYAAPVVPTFTRKPNGAIEEFSEENVDSIHVGATGTVGRLLLDLNITHPNPGTLSVFLSAPTGQYALPVTPEVNAGTSLNRTIDVTRFFRGLPMQGEWSISVEDNVAGGKGTLVSWSLTFEPQWQQVAVAKQSVASGTASVWKSKWDVRAYASGAYNLRAYPVCDPSALAIPDTHTDLRIAQPSISLKSIRFTEGENEDSTYPLVLTLTRPSSQEVKVRVKSLDSAAGTTAKAGVDYISVNEVVTIAPGETRATVELLYADDLAEDEDKKILFALSEGQGATIADRRGDPNFNVATIRDNDEEEVEEESASAAPAAKQPSSPSAQNS